jgi:hypothetical protein
MNRRFLVSLFVAGATLAWACSSDRVAGPGRGQGMLAMKLTDAPVPLDSVKEVDVFIERIDARRAHADVELVNEDMDGDHDEDHLRPDSTQWVTIASPNKAFNLLDLQNGVTAFLGATAVDTGNFKAIRLIVDPTKSTIVLKDGTILTATSTPPLEFENGRRHGLLVELNEPAEVQEKQTTTIVLDFRLGESVTLLGRSVRDGFFFRPVVVGAREGHEHDNH